MGNVQSVMNAFKLLGQDVFLTHEKEDIEHAKAIVLPGVGAFKDGIENLEKSGLIPILEEGVLKKKKPFLGICLGMQLLAEEGTEPVSCRGLGWIKAKTVKIEPAGNLKVPHMGWDTLEVRTYENLYNGIQKDPVCYFLHSYHVEPAESEKNIITALCHYGQEITASLQKGNVFGVQFHPEKSQGAGLKILENFISLC